MKTSDNIVQFDFGKMWHDHILPLRKTPDIQQAFEGLQQIYEDLADWKYDHTLECDESTDLEIAEMVRQLDLHTARVKCFDFHWVKREFEADQLAPFSLAIAERFYPEKEWLILAEGTDQAVVTDTERTLVFDFKNYDKLSGLASLVIAGDTEVDITKLADAEALQFREEKYDEELAKLEKMIELTGSEAKRPALTLVTDEEFEDIDWGV